MKEGFGRLASLDQAKRAIFDLVKETEEEKVGLDKTLHRVLAKDIFAEIDVPHFRKAAMDGFAVIAEDTFSASNINPKKLIVKEKINIGQLPQRALNRGECAQIPTGAPLPDNADSVLMVEYCERYDHTVEFYKAVTPGENVIDIGSDIKKGSLLLKKGTVLNPRFIGLLASQGMSEVPVKKKPTIAYFSTGSEILSIHEQLSAGKVFDINSYTLVNSIKENGGSVLFLGILKDDKKLIKEKINEGLKRADFLLLSGGSSLGAEDLLVEVIQELGEVIIHGIAVKPGKPVLVGKVNNTLVLGLPGYPASALSDFYILVLPLMDRMLGIKRKTRMMKARMVKKVVSTIGRYEFLPVKILHQEEAVPIQKGSSAIASLVEADGFIEIDENIEIIEKGSEIEVNLL